MILGKVKEKKMKIRQIVSLVSMKCVFLRVKIRGNPQKLYPNDYSTRKIPQAIGCRKRQWNGKNSYRNPPMWQVVSFDDIIPQPPERTRGSG